LSGDLTDGSVKDLGEAALPLEKLQPRYGMFFVTGAVSACYETKHTLLLQPSAFRISSVF